MRNVFVVGGIVVIPAGVASAWIFRGYKVPAPAAESHAQPSLLSGSVS
ncbi:MAG TPA: hypothetical protein VND68_01545 [Chloroflexia bacterium]|nr:hypothetical protein [Chloroflexia bacterium]